MDDEKLRVLRLVETGVITPDEAMELLSALAGPGAADTPVGRVTVIAGKTTRGRYALRLAGVPVGGASAPPRWLRLRVVDGQGRSKVNVQLPISVLGLALRLAGRWVPEVGRFDPETILAAMHRGAGGQLFELADERTGERVELTVEA